jgi:hypothetical protein
MAELELTRSKDDRRLYNLEGIGSLRLEGLFSRSATATAAGVRWRMGRVGFWGRRIEAVRERNVLAGEFDPRAIRRGGELRWNGQPYQLRPASNWVERYALAVGDTEVAVIEGKTWGRKPVKLEILRPEAVEPGLLLFAAYVVRGLADDASAAAASVATTSTATTS